MSDFEDIRTKAAALKAHYSSRDAMYKQIEEIYLMEDDTLPTGNYIMKTISSDGRDAAIGVSRLLSATDPEFSVPRESNRKEVGAISGDIEKLAHSIWIAAGRAKQKRIHAGLTLSAVLYGEIHAKVINSNELLKLDKDNERMKLTAVRTPLMFEVLNPKFGFPLIDAHGLAAYYYSQEKTAGDIVSMVGSKYAVEEGESVTKKHIFNEWWDDTDHVVWIDGDDPIINEKHESPVIPISVGLVEGSELFVEDWQQDRQPFLYGMLKSNMFKNINIGLTSMYTNVFALASMGTFLFSQGKEGQTVDVDYNTPGFTVTVPPGAKFEALMKHALDKDMLELVERSRSYATEATIYKQALGEPLGANAPFSMVALLSQQGRLPLVAYQLAASWVVADLMYKGLRLLKHKGVHDESLLEIDLEQIPDSFDLQAILNVYQPQDERQNAQLARTLTEGDDPLASKRYAREIVMNIGQPDEMQKEVWSERYAELEAQLDFEMTAQRKRMIAQIQMRQLQAQMTQAQGGGAGDQQAMLEQLQQQVDGSQSEQMMGQEPPPVGPEGPGVGIPQQGAPPQADAGLPGLPMDEPMPSPNEPPQEI